MKYTFKVVLAQMEPEEGRNFGSKEEWGRMIQRKLNEAFSVADCIEVKPMRNSKSKP